ncbi:Acetyl esterase [Pandoraea iniqua]|uniref:alpha/beta hydrolase fold domain-containing protein n=1 Tax=Pandoraea iniqua TaxID=2508288 RepID=UPI0012428E49|nr:alpha/beta hydrolase fold domain-containing protein [Pandoraea iniqua]VVD67704.1 Acetyl esterase [Pandoraea iniqua]
MNKEIHLLHAADDPGPSPIDPDMTRFMALQSEDGAAFARWDLGTAAQAREAFEVIRHRWASGGPQMYRTVERAVPTRHGDVRIRVYYPHEQASLPALIYLHGGGFVVFSLDTHDRVMREYAARAGVVVVGIDYSRSPEARFPRALEEIVDVTRWLHRHADTLGLDAQAMLIGGDSAGANLSLGTALQLRDAGESLLRGMVFNYGAFDMIPWRDSFARFGGGEYSLSSHDMVCFVNRYINHRDDLSDPRCRPIVASLDNLPPACFAIAELDPLYDENIEMAERLRDAGVPVSATVYPGTIHSFLEAVSIAGVSDRAFAEQAEWIRQRVSA